MSESLRDQLLKSGLVKKIKAEAPPPVREKPRQAEKRQNRPMSGGPPPRRDSPAQVQNAAREPNLAHLYGLRAKQEKEEREAAQRKAEQDAKEKRERKQKLAQLLADKALNSADAEMPRHFPHGNKIRRIYCTADQLARLNRGELAVVQLAGRYLLVEQAVALQAKAVQEDALVLLCDPNAPPEDDVPADLVW